MNVVSPDTFRLRNRIALPLLAPPCAVSGATVVHPLMAGALLGSVPVALIYSFFVEQYAAGLTAGAVKG